MPRPELNEIVGGIFAHYASKFDVKIYAATFLSNHYHWLCQAGEGVISEFAENVNREIAKRVNRYVNRSGSLWHKRYDDLITVEPTDALKALLYIVTNPVHHGLVSHPDRWPGVNCYRQILGAKEQTFSFMNYTAYNRARRLAKARGVKVRKKDFEMRTPLKIEPLPCFSNLSVAQRHAKLDKLIERRVHLLCLIKKVAKKKFLGRQAVLEQPIKGKFPVESSKRNRPRCYTDNAERAAEFKRDEDAKREMYTVASRRFRLGEYEVEFPPFCFKPPTHRIPQSLPT